MKKFIILFAFVLLGTMTYAQQWATLGTNIYNTNTGNVGVGTNTPAQKFTVHNPSAQAILQVERPMASGNGDVASVFAKNASTGDICFFGLKRTAAGPTAVLSAFDAASSTWRAYSVLNLSTGLYQVKASVNNFEYFNTGDVLFSNSGGVGIGVTALGSGVKFQVAGKIKVQEIEVALTPWPDFVFNSDYKLKPLAEVEAFIQENNHLPGVPSQADVEQNGLNLGEMNAVLLQKIEELTLYVIDLKKENDQIKQQLNNLNK